MYISTVLILSHSSSVCALTADIEFWFFAPASRLLSKSLSSPDILFSKQLAYLDNDNENQFVEQQYIENEYKGPNPFVATGGYIIKDDKKMDCIPMGDGCFDPLGGFTEKDQPTKKQVGEQAEVQRSLTQNVFDTNLITCDKNYSFDLFCGEARDIVNKVPSNKLEIWFDISTSMRHIFLDNKNCMQLQFAKKISAMCKTPPVIRVFNTSVKEEHNLQNVCRYEGLNDKNELISQLKKSNAKKIFVITDTDEYYADLKNFIESNNLPIRGMDVPISSDSLLGFSRELIPYCH